MHIRSVLPKSLPRHNPAAKTTMSAHAATLTEHVLTLAERIKASPERPITLLPTEPPSSLFHRSPMPKSPEKQTLTIRIPARPYQTGGISPASKTHARTTAQPASRAYEFDDMDVDGELLLAARMVKTERRPPEPTTSSSSSELLRVSKDYCCLCGDLMRQKKNVCNGCGAYVCEQTMQFGSGCITFGTAPPASKFFCLLCDSKRWRALPQGKKDGGLPVSRLPHTVPIRPVEQRRYAAVHF